MALCPECGGEVTGGRQTKVYCCLKCQQRASNHRRDKRNRQKTYAARSWFNPTQLSSFYESEEERRLRLKRKRL